MRSLAIACVVGWFAPVFALGVDSDGDGIVDEIDVCPGTAPGSPVDAAGRPLADLDGDCDVDLDDFAGFEISFTGPFDCTPEVCDGLDNDCNNQIDDMGVIECGLGSCRREVEACTNGTLNECIPDPPTTEICTDALDNDCDGLADCADFVSCPFHEPCATSLSCDRAGGCTCIDGFDDCDNGPENGCETSIRTLDDCNGCNIGCNLANATESCSTGTCLLTSCNAGFCNLDGLPANGCELNLNSNPVCASSMFLGSVSGDVGTGVLNASGTGERWYRVTVTENENSNFVPVRLSATVSLDVTADLNYDLYVYCTSCAGTVTSSTNGLGVTDVVDMRRNDQQLPDDTFDILIEIRWLSGCGNGGNHYALRVDGNTSVAAANCFP